MSSWGGNFTGANVTLPVGDVPVGSDASSREFVGMQTPELELLAPGHRVQVHAGRPFVIGRGPTADLDLPGGHVSRTHLVIEFTAAGWQVTDHSRYGTFADGRRVQTLQITRPTVVQLGSPPEVTVLELRPAGNGHAHPQPSGYGPPAGAGFGPPAGPGYGPPAGAGYGPPLPHSGYQPGFAPSGRSAAIPPVPGGGVLARQGGGATMQYDIERHGDLRAGSGVSITVGRLPDCDVVLADDLLVSRHHARLERDAGGWRITDLGSGNGTFVNGVRVAGVAGHRARRRSASGTRCCSCRATGSSPPSTPATSPSRRADISVVTDKGKTLLHDVSFALPGRGPARGGRASRVRASRRCCAR